MTRRLALSGTANTRDLGGYPTPGGVTAWGRFFRSDAPIDLTEADIQALRQRGLTTHIDLRTAGEIQRRKSALEGLPGFEYHPVDLCARMQMLPESEAGVPSAYFEMTCQSEPMARVFRIIAGAKDGVFFHCTAGKDRTGVVAAILLMLAGVGRADLLADYLLTTAYLREPLKKYLKTDPDVPAYIIVPKVEYMEGFLDQFNGAYAGARGYLESIGLSEEEIHSITQRLILLTKSFPIC